MDEPTGRLDRPDFNWAGHFMTLMLPTPTDNADTGNARAREFAVADLMLSYHSASRRAVSIPGS